jgi:thiol-disulfide isomerase/thioredoxin
MKMKFKIIFLLLTSMFVEHSGYSQGLKTVNFTSLEKELRSHGDSVVLVNFWATWCKPCVEEMKYFVKAQNEFKSKKLSFTYVSLDFLKQKEKANEFISRQGLKGNNYLLKDDPNVWINKVDVDWAGDIPYTLLVLPDGSYIRHNAKFDSWEELDNFIKTNFK